MTYEVSFDYKDEYCYVSRNQHGARYEKTGIKQIRVLKMSCNIADNMDIQTLVLIGSELREPVRYDFKEQKAWIKIRSAS